MHRGRHIRLFSATVQASHYDLPTIDMTRSHGKLRDPQSRESWGRLIREATRAVPIPFTKFGWQNLVNSQEAPRGRPQLNCTETDSSSSRKFRELFCACINERRQPAILPAAVAAKRQFFHDHEKP
jgi:hypothetical protein